MNSPIKSGVKGSSGKQTTMKEIFTSTNLGSTEKVGGLRKMGSIWRYYMFGSPPLSYTGFYPIFLTKGKVQQQIKDCIHWSLCESLGMVSTTLGLKEMS